MRDYVERLADALGKPVFDGMVRELDANGVNDDTVREFRKSMAATHYWCSLFLALAQAMGTYGKAWDRIADMTKQVLAESVAKLHDGKLDKLRQQVVGILADKACGALRSFVEGQNPALALMGSEDLLRALRILAVFCCPNAAEHPDIDRFCVKPLMADARSILQDKTRDRLQRAFGLDM